MTTPTPRSLRRLLTALPMAGLLAGCASTPTNVAPLPPAKYQVLGQAEGKGCGSLGLLFPVYSFLPIGLNERVERAYQDALASVPGATSLVNVSVVEHWNWWLLATQRCVTVTGDAIKEVS
ncbi:hypothetical protein [Piscinibacter sp. HJYY11]|uniref:hypothetical protein n=1 Tax=Piscinibacter sp. HJYY11 TaxID=2801333 RepID=UPI00191D5BEE|nr:hypothetical protein [Piscinibacter sp. HJYY11]MBL0729279.1 hypothetical protein [Piscinibacter sp. HJYY11]